MDLTYSPPRRRGLPTPQIVAYAILTLGALAMVTPFIWMVATSFKSPGEILQPRFLPEDPTGDNYTQVLTRTLFPQWYLNSLVAAAISTASVGFFDSLTGYVFSKFEFPGKRIAFILVLATLMVPTEMLVIPWYVMAQQTSLVDTTLGIVFPGLITATGVFLMRQAFKSVPDELLDAARIDGMNEFGIFSTVAWPLVMPSVAAICIFNFLGNWNAYIWPLIVTSKRATMTLPIGLAFFSSEAGSAWNLIMAGATLSTVPLLTVFVFLQRQIIQGVALTGMKS
ncbi:MAG: carbohydrate ABC transporter permease [Thermoflexales bacterium]|nr:carbohydrate ABC transporter permease [Thermoflexales bacterium]